jgi:hypothetical protein
MITISSSDYNGDFTAFLYLVMSVGNETVAKGAARIVSGIAKKRALPKISQTADPWGDYDSGAPTADTVTTTYAERSLEPGKMMLYEEFLPEDLWDIWEKWHPVGDFSNLEQNPEFLADVIALYANNGGTQLSKLFWQGDTTLGAGNPLNKHNGIITRVKTDPNVIAVTPAGIITKASVVDRVADVWNAIPDKFMEEPSFLIHMNTTDFKLLQEANNDAKKTTVGVLDETIRRLFLEKRIVHYQGLPKNHILGAVSMPDSEMSNLYIGYYVEPTRENPVIMKVNNSGKTWFVRIDAKQDANYKEGSEIVFYEPL